MTSSLARLTAGLLIIVAVAGCALVAPPAALRTAAEARDVCEDALLTGTLARHPGSGLGVTSADGQAMAVEWPFGYTARTELGRLALVDETGQVVAHEGDEISVGGGFGNELWHACRGGVTAVPGS